jgi:hypothetical protein
MHRNRVFYFFILVIVIFLGLGSRHFSKQLPDWNDLYVGDALWAMMVFLIIGLIFNNKPTWWVALIALIFSYSIEVSQLYHAPWIDCIRATWLGAHVLGFGFLWSDLVCYSVGIFLCYSTEKVFYSSSR